VSVLRSMDRSVARLVKEGLGIGERGLRVKAVVRVCSTGELRTASRTGSNAGIVTFYLQVLVRVSSLTLSIHSDLPFSLLM